MPVAPIVVCVMGVMGELIQAVGMEEGALALLMSTTVMVPVAFILPQPPVRGML